MFDSEVTISTVYSLNVAFQVHLLLLLLLMVIYFFILYVKSKLLLNIKNFYASNVCMFYFIMLILIH